MTQLPKSKLPYILREALETGGWKITTANSNHEVYERNPDRITIGAKLLHGTNPPSVVYQLQNLANMEQERGITVINSLCAMVAKKHQ